MRDDTPTASAEGSGLADGPPRGSGKKKPEGGEKRAAWMLFLLKQQQQIQSQKDAGVKRVFTVHSSAARTWTVSPRLNRLIKTESKQQGG